MGETITSLAAKVPMSYGYLSQLERRHRVSMSPPLFRRLAAVLGVDDREIRAE
ncbi:hypothetical protein EDC02_6306 [Micromonospora sp. Llam0]|nr:hypothetical protein EDC02_6306 [Micromonospora sp. Llam0]